MRGRFALTVTTVVVVARRSAPRFVECKVSNDHDTNPRLDHDRADDHLDGPVTDGTDHQEMGRRSARHCRHEHQTNRATEHPHRASRNLVR